VEYPVHPLKKSFINYRPYYAFGAYFLAYALLVLVPNPEHATLVKYHLSNTGLRWLELTVILPSAITWFLTFYGYERLSRYSKVIKNTKDGLHIATIAKALGVLAYLTPLSTIVYTVFGLLIRHHPGLISTQAITRNYTILLIPFIAFLMIEHGAHGLTGLTKSRPSRFSNQIIVPLFIVISVAYSYLVIKNSDTPLVAGNSAHAYYMPDILVLLTIVVPYLYMWFIGMFAVTELLLYQDKIKGIIYKRSWAYISRGFIGVIAASIIIQYVTSLSGKLNRLHLNGLLAVVYILLILQAVGYVFIALGAKKLQKIEEV
jgi:hypothetical protein